MIPQIKYITNIAPLYRKNLWSALLKNPKFNIQFYFGHGNNGIKEMNFDSENFKPHVSKINFLKNIWLNKRVLIWQRNSIAKSLVDHPDIVVLLGEFNVLSNWIIALIYRLRKIPVVMYGHGIYGNENWFKLIIRTSYLKLANAHLVYEEYGKQRMLKHGFKRKQVFVFYNSLDYDQQLIERKNLLNKSVERFPFFKNNKAKTVVFIGRLTPEKKLNQLIELLANLQTKIEANLLIIGEGQLKNELTLLANQKLTPKSFHFYGQCYNEKELGRLLFMADLCVSPGNVGLTAIHSLSYGTPVATHSNMKEQMPEAASIEPNASGFFFEQNDIVDLTNKTIRWFKDHGTQRGKIRENCFKVIDQKYNPYNQQKIFEQMIDNLLVAEEIVFYEEVITD